MPSNVSEHKRTTLKDVRQVLDNYCRDNDHSSNKNERWLASYLKPVHDLCKQVDEGKLTNADHKRLSLEFEIQELSRQATKKEDEASRIREERDRAQRELVDLNKGKNEAKGHRGGFTASVAILLFAVGMIIAGFAGDAIAQRIHRYHFECIGAGFTSQQCSFLGDMLRRYGVN